MRTIPVLALCALLGAPAVGAQQQAPQDVLLTAARSGAFTKLVTAAVAADLAGTLRTSGPFTVLAPDDAAFAALPEGALAGLLGAPDKLAALLKDHVVAGAQTAEELLAARRVTTLGGRRITVSIQAGRLCFDGVPAKGTDLRCSNGVVHVLERVLLPADADGDAAALDEAAPTARTPGREVVAGRLMEFRRGEDVARWNIILDGVMGGLSSGRVELETSGIGVFEGNLSLENRGGFSMARFGVEPDALADFDGVVLRVRGDGRAYQLCATTTTRVRPDLWEASFEAPAGEWVEVAVPFSALTRNIMGFKPRSTPPDAADLRTLGIILADKKTGPFRLQIDWIRPYRDAPAGP